MMLSLSVIELRLQYAGTDSEASRFMCPLLHLVTVVAVYRGRQRLFW
jgi:hypothetical protein